MQQLRGKAIEIFCHDHTPPHVFRVTDNPDRPAPFRRSEGYICRAECVPEGFKWYLQFAGGPRAALPDDAARITLPDSFSYIEDGDIVRTNPARGDFGVLYQRNAMHHTFLLTERCNHYCLMCSQPPRVIDDGWIVDEIKAALPLIDQSAKGILFTGGEPTLLGPQLVELVGLARSYLPNASVHILTNGRAFKEATYAAKFSAVRHPDLMFGIPIYSDQSDRHDHIVQADGAFDETIRGILNLKRSGQKVEIRVVIHGQSYQRLPQLSNFIARNLTFVDQVVFMGLEITGFTRANLDQLWIDPVDYQSELFDAVAILSDSRIPTAIYNHQLCITHRDLWPFTRKSISDWKNEYLPECAGCGVKGECGGFFASAKLKHSDHIAAVA
jgi:His-Xaa-Ser system radical SAM maturase HxsC